MKRFYSIFIPFVLLTFSFLACNKKKDGNLTPITTEEVAGLYKGEVPGKMNPDEMMKIVITLCPDSTFVAHHAILDNGKTWTVDEVGEYSIEGNVISFSQNGEVARMAAYNDGALQIYRKEKDANGKYVHTPQEGENMKKYEIKRVSKDIPDFPSCYLYESKDKKGEFTGLRIKVRYMHPFYDENYIRYSVIGEKETESLNFVEKEQYPQDFENFSKLFAISDDVDLYKNDKVSVFVIKDHSSVMLVKEDGELQTFHLISPLFAKYKDAEGEEIEVTRHICCSNAKSAVIKFSDGKEAVLKGVDGEENVYTCEEGHKVTITDETVILDKAGQVKEYKKI